MSASQDPSGFEWRSSRAGWPGHIASVRQWLAGLAPDRRAALQARVAVELADRAVYGVVAYELLAILIFASTPYPREHPALVAAFLVATIAIGLLRLWGVRLIRRGQGGARERGVLAFNAGAYLAAVAWSALVCVTITLYAWQWTFWLTIFCSSGIAAGATTAISPNLRLARRYLVVLFVPATLMFVADLSVQGATLALIFVMYLSFLLVQTARQYDWYWQGLRESELLLDRNAEIRGIHARHERELEGELDRLKNHLLRVDRLATLGTLAGGTGHELNNISMILSAALASVVRAAEEGRPPQPRDLERLRRVEMHVAIHVKQLLSLGKPDGEEPGRLELGKVVRDTVDMLHTARRTTSVEVELELPEAPVYVRATKMRVEQVLVNLIGNAVDALDEVSRPVKRVRVRIERAGSGRMVSLAIQDNGSGIAEDQLGRIFQPYFTTKSSSRGTGLGLPVVKRILEGLGGSISVSSERGVGSTFVASLPAFDESAAAAAVPSPAPQEAMLDY